MRHGGPHGVSDLKSPLITISRHWLSVDFIHAGKWRLDDERYQEVEALVKQRFPRHAKCLGFGNFMFIRLKASETEAARKFAGEILRLYNGGAA